MFRVGRLLLGVLVTVHFFACAYWRVKVIYIYIYISCIVVTVTSFSFICGQY